MKRLVYYKPTALTAAASEKYPGTFELAQYFRLYSAGAVPIDRTGTIRTPVRTHSLFPMPKLRPIRKSFEEICNDRAAKILAQAEALDCNIFTMWSGGIDSTLALISILKNARQEQKKRITVLMSEQSIIENPNFYRDSIRHKLRADTSSTLPAVIGSKHILVSGEHNDQLFGSDLMAKLIVKHGSAVIHQPYTRDVFFTHYNSVLTNSPVVHRYLDLFEKLQHRAPMPITTNYDFAWWVNFSLKWQTVYARLLTFVAPHKASTITKEYVDTYYFPFYNTEDFQLWSMNNLDKRIKDTWKTYKWPCKDIIYEFTGDADYRDNKVKRGSLNAFLKSRDAFKFLDENFGLHEHLDPETYYEPDNDFKLSSA